MAPVCLLSIASFLSAGKLHKPIVFMLLVLEWTWALFLASPYALLFLYSILFFNGSVQILFSSQPESPGPLVLIVLITMKVGS